MGIEEFDKGVSPYALFVQGDDGKFYVIPVSSKWYGFRTIINRISNTSTNFSIQSLRNKRRKKKWENNPISKARKLKLKREKEIIEESRKIDMEDAIAKREYNIDFDIENEFEDDASTIKDFRGDNVHHIQEVPDGYDLLNKIDEMDDEKEDEGKIDWVKKKKFLLLREVRSIGKRERKEDFSIKDQPQLKKKRENGGGDEKKRSEFDKLKGKVVRFLTLKGGEGCSVKELIKHTRITMAAKGKKNKGYQNLVVILKEFCERKKKGTQYFISLKKGL